MSIEDRSPEIRKMHGESLVKLGEKLQEAVIYAFLITPFAIFGKSLFEGDQGKIVGYIDTIVNGSDFLIILLCLMSLAHGFGIWIKNKGYDLIEAANEEI